MTRPHPWAALKKPILNRLKIILNLFLNTPNLFWDASSLVGYLHSKCWCDFLFVKLGSKWLPKKAGAGAVTYCKIAKFIVVQPWSYNTKLKFSIISQWSNSLAERLFLPDPQIYEIITSQFAGLLKKAVEKFNIIW